MTVTYILTFMTEKCTYIPYLEHAITCIDMQQATTLASPWFFLPSPGPVRCRVCSSILLILNRHTYSEPMLYYIDLQAHESCMHVAVKVLHSCAFILFVRLCGCYFVVDLGFLYCGDHSFP